MPTYESREELARRLLELLTRIGAATIKRLATDLGTSERVLRAVVRTLEAAGRISTTRTRPMSVMSVEGPTDPPPGPPRAPSTQYSEPRPRFDKHDLDRMVVSMPLAELLADIEQGMTESDRFQVHNGRISVIVDLNLAYPGGLLRARHRVFDLLVRLAGATATATADARRPTLDRVAPAAFREASGQYVYARLRPEQIYELVELDQRRPPALRAIYRLWPDNVVKADARSSLATIKSDAATATFGCSGKGIVWAVLDSGIDGGHPHFGATANLEELPPGIVHMDYTHLDDENAPAPSPLTDAYGHGTHVAGIIAGSLKALPDGAPIEADTFERDRHGNPQTVRIPHPNPTGVAPECKLVSYKVLDHRGRGGVMGVIAALEEIYRANGHGKLTRIHGVNMSLGYPFEPRWFACGHSPLCEVVDRLARSGVVVVVSAGNNGYGLVDFGSAGTWGQGMAMSITDPGNAERAITVGATHRDSPHTFGVSYFSSKGPTGDGRQKPDLLAPGEKIVSCASTSNPPAGEKKPALYKEDSGTSMAAPHVSGAIAAFLSVRTEFIGKSDAVKELFLSSALDLKRDRTMQGHGLLDLLRALQSS